MNKLILITFTGLLLVTLSCSRKQDLAKTQFQLTSSSLVNGTQMSGGIYLWAVPSTNDSAILPIKQDLDADDSVYLPFGTYALHIVGYEGPGPWSGATQCGSTSEPVNLEQDEITINISLNSTNCGNEPYLSMINEKAASLVPPNNWDQGKWDESTWGP